MIKLDKINFNSIVYNEKLEVFHSKTESKKTIIFISGAYNNAEDYFTRNIKFADKIEGIINSINLQNELVEFSVLGIPSPYCEDINNSKFYDYFIEVLEFLKISTDNFAVIGNSKGGRLGFDAMMNLKIKGLKLLSCYNAAFTKNPKSLERNLEYLRSINELNINIGLYDKSFFLMNYSYHTNLIELQVPHNFKVYNAGHNNSDVFKNQIMLDIISYLFLKD